MTIRSLLVLCLLLAPLRLGAGEVTLAVASNVLPTARILAERFEDASDHGVRLVHGSTGRLYAQIRAGAPFDVFLAADTERPAALEAEGLARDRRGYADGRLVLVGPEDAALDRPLDDMLAGRRVALADPALAPYGVAAQAVLDRAGPAAGMVQLTVENVAQVATLMATGNAEYGFLALSLLPALQAVRPVSSRLFGAGDHPPIRQDAVLLARAGDDPAALAFWDWLGGEAAAAIFAADGYGRPTR